MRSSRQASPSPGPRTPPRAGRSQSAEEAARPRQERRARAGRSQSAEEAARPRQERRARAGPPLVMGVVNVTPDSFYPASRSPGPEAAVARARRLLEEGADLLDIGGQSTRPGSSPVPQAEELRRVLPVFEALGTRVRVPLSIDTDKAAVARACRKAGASILNDVSAWRQDPAMLEEALAFERVILMHRGGESPKTMQESPRYDDVVAEVLRFLEERTAALVSAGGDQRRIWVDPGIGFGKTLDHNLSLLRHIGEFVSLGPVVLGVSRKSFIGKIMAEEGDRRDIPEPEERLEGSLAGACWASLQGVHAVRVHDVLATRRALGVLSRVRGAD